MSKWMSMECAPKNGESVILMTPDRILQACYFGGKWREEREWTARQLRQSEPDIKPIAWSRLK